MYPHTDGARTTAAALKGVLLALHGLLPSLAGQPVRLPCRHQLPPPVCSPPLRTCTCVWVGAQPLGSTQVKQVELQGAHGPLSAVFCSLPPPLVLVLLLPAAVSPAVADPHACHLARLLQFVFGAPGE